MSRPNGQHAAGPGVREAMERFVAAVGEAERLVASDDHADRYAAATSSMLARSCGGSGAGGVTLVVYYDPFLAKRAYVVRLGEDDYGLYCSDRRNRFGTPLAARGPWHALRTFVESKGLEWKRADDGPVA